MIKTIFFDFDGVLTNDGSSSHTTCQNLQKHLPDVTLERILKCYRANTHALLLGQITHAAIWNDFCACICKNLDIGILDTAFRNTPLNKEMMDLCGKLKGEFKLGIITDNSKERMDVMKKTLGLEDIFEIIIVSGETGARKDIEANFVYAINFAGCRAEECIFIDNNESNLIAPRKMGFKTIYYDDKKKDTSALIHSLKSEGVTVS